MIEDKIIRSFNVDHESEETLVSQFRRRLADFIRESPDGARIPPERKLAESLNISRVTIRNAMREFFESGAIRKCGRRGTFVSRKSQSVMPNDIHPMALGLTRKPASRPLKLLLYENIPYQKTFWESVVHMFNDTVDGPGVEIAWLPNNVTADGLEDHVHRASIDIAQTELSIFSSDNAAELSKAQTDFIQSDKFTLTITRGELARLAKNVAPIHQTTPFVFWNADLAETIGLRGIHEKLRNGEILKLFQEAAEKLPYNINATGHIWDIPALLGLPHETTDATIATHVEKVFETLSEFAGTSNMFITEQRRPFDMIDSFRKGETLFICTTPPNVFVYGNKMGFKIGAEPFPVPEENYARGSGIGLFVPRTCHRPEAALDFISFILSEKAQKMMAETKWVVPCRRGSLKNIAKTLGCPENVLKGVVARSIIELQPNTLAKRYAEQIVYNARSELCYVLSEKKTPAQCAASFTRRWNAEYHVRNFEHLNKSA